MKRAATLFVARFHRLKKGLLQQAFFIFLTRPPIYRHLSMEVKIECPLDLGLTPLMQ